MQPAKYLGRNAAGKGHGSLEIFSTTVMGGGIWRNSGMKQKEQNNAKEYWEANRIQKAVRKLRKAKEDWIGTQC